MQDPHQAKPRPPPPPQSDIRDGSLAILLNNDVQPPPPTMAYDQSQLITAMDFSLDFTDLAPLDNVLKEPNMIDWVCLKFCSFSACVLLNLPQTILDHILLERPESTYRPAAM